LKSSGVSFFEVGSLKNPEKAEEGEREMKRVLAIQHASVNPPGLLGDILTKHDIACDVIQAEEGKLPSDTTPYHAVVIFGGLEHVYDEPYMPHIKQEKRLIQHALGQKLPFLGICFGCQLLASTLGANVYPTSPGRLGFVRAELTKDGQQDPFYQGLPGYQQAFQWHDDLIDLPERAQLLSVANGNEVQAFRAGESAYGVLYHIELTKEMLQNWLFDPSSKKEFIEKSSMENYQKTEQEYQELYPLYHEHASKLIENFLRISSLI
jgi:GMP synthase (glutamine-hydrolysing)